MRETRSDISVDTARAVLVPAGSFEKGTEEEYLRFNGMALSAGEVALTSEERDGIVAVMAVSVSEWDAYKNEYERGEVSVTSPLLVVATGRDGRRGGRAVDLLLTAENVYIAVWEKGLKMAEALPDNSVDSLLYYMQVVGRRFRLRGFDINVSGVRADVAADALRRYFGRKVKVLQ